MMKSFFSIFKPTRREKLEAGQRGFYEVRLFAQIIDNVKYAGNDLLFLADGVAVYGRECHNTLYKIIFVDDYEAFLTADLSNDNLTAINLETEFKNGFNLASLKCDRQICLTIFKKKNAETILYCKKHLSFEGKKLDMAMVFNQQKVTLDYYRYLPSFDNLIVDFNNLMYFDIGARDKEME